jgi:membrane associated rhomboid family serine protease
VTTFVLRVVVRVQAYWVIGGWIVLPLISLASDDNDGVAYVAHGGGLIAGIIIFVLMRPAGVDLFNCIDPEEVAEVATTD